MVGQLDDSKGGKGRGIEEEGEGEYRTAWVIASRLKSMGDVVVQSLGAGRSKAERPLMVEEGGVMVRFVRNFDGDIRVLPSIRDGAMEEQANRVSAEGGFTVCSDS